MAQTQRLKGYLNVDIKNAYVEIILDDSASNSLSTSRSSGGSPPPPPPQVPPCRSSDPGQAINPSTAFSPGLNPSQRSRSVGAPGPGTVSPGTQPSGSTGIESSAPGTLSGVPSTNQNSRQSGKSGDTGRSSCGCVACACGLPKAGQNTGRSSCGCVACACELPKAGQSQKQEIPSSLLSPGIQSPRGSADGGNPGVRESCKPTPILKPVIPSTPFNNANFTVERPPGPPAPPPPPPPPPILHTPPQVSNVTACPIPPARAYRNEIGNIRLSNSIDSTGNSYYTVPPNTPANSFLLSQQEIQENNRRFPPQRLSYEDYSVSGNVGARVPPPHPGPIRRMPRLDSLDTPSPLASPSPRSATRPGRISTIGTGTQQSYVPAGPSPFRTLDFSTNSSSSTGQSSPGAYITIRGPEGQVMERIVGILNELVGDLQARGYELRTFPALDALYNTTSTSDPYSSTPPSSYRPPMSPYITTGPVNNGNNSNRVYLAGTPFPGCSPASSGSRSNSQSGYIGSSYTGTPGGRGNYLI